MHKHTMSLIGLLALCACQPALIRTVSGLTASGDFVQATEVTVRAVKSGDERAPELLEQASADAYKYEWDKAREAEADGRLSDSLATYDDLLGLAARVQDAGGPQLDTLVQQERSNIAEATAHMFAARAEVAYDDARWQDSLDAWRMAEKTAPGTTDALGQIPTSLERLGDQATEDHRYRDAIALYQQSVEAGGGDSARAWSAAIHAAIGRHALDQGACRKAVIELTKAAALPFDLSLGQDLDNARSCARRQVIVLPFEDLVDGGLDDKNVGVLLVDQIGHQLRTGSTPFIQLIDPASAVAKQNVRAAGRRYEVRGHLTRVDIVRTDPTTTSEKAEGVLKVPCEPGGDPVCDEKVVVSYTLRSEGLAVTISGNIKVVDVVTGEQVATKPLDIKVDKHRRQMLDPKITDVRGYGLDAQIAARATESAVALHGDARRLIKTPPALPDPARIVDEAMVRLAAVAAKAVLAHIDTETALPDPTMLELVTPIVNADDILFGDSTIHEHTPEDIVFGDDKPVADEAQ
ncbi:MAG: tetratricopeptide (TPR) repeat protein [Kiritimatiellia bacterium]|jgi:tetratricopeptide (TPR) repeat protein